MNSFGGNLSNAGLIPMPQTGSNSPNSKLNNTQSFKNAGRTNFVSTLRKGLTHKDSNLTTLKPKRQAVITSINNDSFSAKAISLVKAKTSLKYGFGSNLTPIDPIQAYGIVSTEQDNINRVVYKVGNQLCCFDPETNQQTFFDQSSIRNITNISHFCISPNQKYISVCEGTRHEYDDINNIAQASIYDLNTFKLVKTITRPNSNSDFIMSTFATDSKILITMIDDSKNTLKDTLG